MKSRDWDTSGPALWGGSNHQFNSVWEGLRQESASLRHLPPCGEASTGGCGRDILDTCSLTCGLQKHLPWIM